MGSDDWRREQKSACVIRHWTKSNSKNDRDVALQLLFIDCIYCIHLLCSLRLPTWLSRCWQLGLLRGATRSAVRHHTETSGTFGAGWWTAFALELFGLCQFGECRCMGPRLYKLSHLILVMLLCYIRYVSSSVLSKCQGDRMECCGTRVQDHGQWRSCLGASWTSTGSKSEKMCSDAVMPTSCSL